MLNKIIFHNFYSTTYLLIYETIHKVCSNLFTCLDDMYIHVYFITINTDTACVNVFSYLLICFCNYYLIYQKLFLNIILGFFFFCNFFIALIWYLFNKQTFFFYSYRWKQILAMCLDDTYIYKPFISAAIQGYFLYS